MQNLKVFVLSICLMASPAFAAVTIAAVGDLMMGTDYPSSAGLANRDFFKNVAPYLERADIRFANFEGTLYDGPQNADGKPGGANRYIFRTPTSMAPHLTRAGFNVVS